MKYSAIRAVLILSLLAVATGGVWLVRQPSSAASAAAPVAQATQQVSDARGEHAIPLHPQRIAAFDPGALDNLDALGVEVLGVAGDTFPAHLARFASPPYLRLGTFFDPDYEALNAAEPDLIVAGGRASPRYEQLARIAPTLDMPADDAHPVQVTFDNLQLLGRVFQREARAEQLIAAARGEIEQLRSKTQGRGAGLIVMVSGGKLSAYGPGSRFGILHSGFGVPAAVQDLPISLHGEAVNFEYLLKTNPDWLFVIDRDSAIGQAGAARQVLDNAIVRQTTAWQSGQVVYLEPANWYLVTGGIQALRAMVRQLSERYDQPS